MTEALSGFGIDGEAGPRAAMNETWAAPLCPALRELGMSSGEITGYIVPREPNRIAIYRTASDASTL